MDITKDTTQGPQPEQIQGAEQIGDAAAQESAEDVIIIPTPVYDPKLDPNNPEFDIELWKAATGEINLDRLKERAQESAQRMTETLKALLELPEWKEHAADFPHAAIQDAARRVSEIVVDFWMEEQGANITQAFDSFGENIIDLPANLLITKDYSQSLHRAIRELIDFLPQDEEEPAAAPEEPDENQITLFTDEQPTDKPPKDFIQLFGEPSAEKKPKRKRTKKQVIQEIVSYSVLETILQNNTTNALTKFSTKRDKTFIDPITGEAQIKRGDFILKIPHYNELRGELKNSTWQLLDALTLKLTANPRKEKEATVTISQDEYMQRRGLKDRKAAKEQAIADMEILKSASVTLEEISGKGRVSYRFINLADSGSVERNGDITLTFGATFHRNLIASQIMPYSTALLKVNNHRNPNSYFIGRKIDEYKNMNALHVNAGDIISVKTLLENAPFIPSYEDVAAADRAFTRRIIEPFERDMDALQEAGAFSWEYCHKNGIPLTAAELEAFSYDVFIACNVKITWAEYPDQTKRRETLEAKIAQAKAQEAGAKRKRGRPRKQRQETE